MTSRPRRASKPLIASTLALRALAAAITLSSRTTVRQSVTSTTTTALTRTKQS